MKHKRTLFTFAIALCILVFGILVSLYFSSVDHENIGSITLPQDNENNEEIFKDIRSQNLLSVKEIVIDKSNVQKVIALLKRPYEYSFKNINTIYSDDNPVSVSAILSVSGDKAKTVIYDGEIPKVHTLIDSQYIYTWINGSRRVVKLPKGKFNYDDISKIPTYESLIAEENITSAKTISVENDIFIEVICQNEVTNIEENYKLSVSDGLLKEAIFKQDGKIVSHSIIENLSLEPISQGIFALPK